MSLYSKGDEPMTRYESYLMIRERQAWIPVACGLVGLLLLPVIVVYYVVRGLVRSMINIGDMVQLLVFVLTGAVITRFVHDFLSKPQDMNHVPHYVRKPPTRGPGT